MLNNQFRTSLTRDEIIGVLLGWIKGPDILVFPEEMEIGPSEQEALELHAYSVYEDWKERKETAWAKYAACLEAGEKRDSCRGLIDAFDLEDEEFRRIRDEIDDEISKGEKSMFRLDHRTSNDLYPCYTRISVDEWIAHRQIALFSNSNFDLEGKSDKSKTTSNQLITRKKPSKLQQQMDLILQTIRRFGFDPMNLPSVTHQGGVRSQLVETLDGKPPFESTYAFKKAWEKLRENKSIKGGEMMKR